MYSYFQFRVLELYNVAAHFSNYMCCPPADPTGPCTILQPQDKEIGEFHEVQEHPVTEFEAQKL